MSGDGVGDLLRAHNLRVTPQRRAIVAAFRGTVDEHLAAEEVMTRAGSAVPEIGRGTVYATLAELTEVGVLASVGSSDPIRYETNIDAHDHFRCRLCQRLFDVDLGGRELARQRVAGHQVEAVSVQAEGTCAECREFARGLVEGVAAAMGTPALPAPVLSGLACARVESPVGDLALAASAEGIVRLAFTDHADFDPIAERAGTRRGPVAGRARLGDVRRSLDGYFAGEQRPIADVIDWQLFSEPEEHAMLAVQRIPYARPLSYDRIVSELDAFAFGRLMGVNPLPLLCPCHRISRGVSQLETWVGGLERLRFLQALESST